MQFKSLDPNFFQPFGIEKYKDIIKKIINQTGSAVGNDLSKLAAVHIILKLIMDRKSTSQLIKVSEQDLGISRYRMWEASRNALRLVGWKIVERCENTCGECHTNWKSLVVTLESGKFVPMCPRCNHHTVNIYDIPSIPRWSEHIDLFTCSHCKVTSDRYIIEVDPFRPYVVQVICPNCIASFHYRTISGIPKKVIETVMANELNSVLYFVQQFFNIPTQIIKLARYILGGVKLPPTPLFNVFGAIEIAKILLCHKEITNYRKYIRKPIEIIKFNKNRWMDSVLTARKIKIVEDTITTCQCNHTNFFIKESREIRCPECFGVINVNSKFTAFSEVDLLG